jgi:hypothetical protein
MRAKTKGGLRARVARTLADLDPTRKRSRSRRLTDRATAELAGAAEEIRKRFLGEPARTAGARKAAATRKRNAAKRSAAAKKGAQTRAKAGR